MASLVAYDDSGSEAEPEPAGRLSAADQVEDTSDVVTPHGQDFASGVLDRTEVGALPTEHGSREDPAGRRLPLVRLWGSDPGARPARRLQWPRMEPEVTVPTSEPSHPSLWTSHAPAGHMPLAAARFKQVKLSWGVYDSPEPSLGAQTKSEAPGKNGSSLQRKRHEDCVIPYTPKRLRQMQTSNPGTGESKDVEAQGPSVGRAPAPLCVAPGVSEFIQPYLDSQYKETMIPKSVLFCLRGHRGPVNSVQWCPVFSKSHMLLSVSMDKTFKVWNAVDSGRCLQTYFLHHEAVRAAQWSPCGQRILSGGFDFALHLTDLETGTQLFSAQSDFRITTLKFHPKDHSLFVCGGFSSEIKAWDIRTGKERYTCPSLTLHPREPVFLAQTNGNYLALFSAVWPYRMSRRRRYEGHKVEGYSVGCECSPDGDLLVTGSADGRVLLYSFRTASRARTLPGHAQACVGTTFHPVLPSVLATCSWEGDIKIWH
ncbi:WD repeat-containing protein 25 isoform X2 [Manis pentadactyla]|uniref:WD repeat-containing protein 25 isoform X2 n=1 Tax=Manis pentadactyla TaxID=143292 RepID=UPI00187577C3|nr:WD repeat-containing protein 25 isoform X2 [Manis pentadactyla]